ncbi:MAG TPA: MXAN_5187 C-terminal domain-containing protein [Pyrinomonadaceae bacterium]|nr:MXAN_5187 C-terminal domain-containing protein [Pyrinomonadaceae bacterium]
MPIRQNSFARRAREQQQQQAQSGVRKTIIERDAQPTIDEQLVRLEDDVRKLKVEFDIYFNGSSKRPPYDTKGRVETLIKRLADERQLTYAQRYHYNSLVARYTSFRDLWRRTIQDREEGRGAFAARAAAKKESESAPVAPASTFVCADARTDVPTVKSLYDTLVEAKRQCGERVDDFSFAQFHRMLAQKTETLKERLGCERVRYSVQLEGGRVQFKAKADK